MNYRERLEGLRGRDYYAEWWRIWEDAKTDVRALMDRSKHVNGKTTLGDLIQIADALNLPFKPLVLALEKEGWMRTGAWDCLRTSGFSMNELRAEITQMREAGQLEWDCQLQTGREAE